MLPRQGDSSLGIGALYFRVFRLVFYSFPWLTPFRRMEKGVDLRKSVGAFIFFLVGCCIVCVVRVGARASGLAAPLVLLFETTPIGRSPRGIVWAFDERMRVFFHANISSPLASHRAVVSSHTILGISSDSGDRSSSDKSILSGLFLDTTITRLVLSWTHGE